MHESNELVSNSGSTNNSPVPTRSSGATNNLPSMSSVIKTRREHNIKDTNLLQEAIKIYQEKDSLSKAIKYLISKEFMANTPQEVASFLRIYKNNFDPAAIGDYLGEGGRTPEEEKYWDHVRYQYTRAVSFVDMDIEPSLRLYLTGCGFRMPGEAQKIDRFMSAFVKIFWQDNHGTEYSPFKHSDTVHLLGYAIIMLNTDLHRANMDKKKNAKKMTKEQFIKNLRGADQGDDIPSSYLSKIYDNIAATPIEMAVDIPKDTNSLPVTNGNDSNTETNPELMGLFVQDMLRNLRSSEDLLRSLSSRMHRFYIMGIDISISLELVCFMFESVWNNFYAISDTLLTTLNNDENVIFSALDLLSNTLSSCIFLDLKVEKIAFATLLAKFRKMCEACESASTTNSKIALTGASFATGAFRNNEKWFSSVENSTAETAIMAIADIFRMIVHLKDVIRVFSRREVTKTVFARIEKKANIADANRFFLTEGDLKKRNRNGKLTSYRFFLFSDILIYCHYGFSEYKVHEQMELDTMEIRSIVEHDPANIQFAIIHPTKSFTVMADSVQEKMSWVRTLNEAIDACVQRKSCQKLDILDRMQHQENKVNERSAIIENYGRSQNSMKYIASTPVKDKSNKQLDADKTNEDGTAKQVSFDDSSNLEQQKVSEGSSPSSDAVSDDPEYESLLPCATSRNREYSLTSDTVTSNSVMADKHTNDPMLANDIKVDKDVYHDRNSEYEEEDRNDNNMMDDDLSSEVCMHCIDI
jgi:brefeldin A-inhibited guanine nucleotide-exchange protein